MFVLFPGWGWTEKSCQDYIGIHSAVNSPVVKYQCGANHCCALHENHDFRCCGSNYYGELGTGGGSGWAQNVVPSFGTNFVVRDVSAMHRGTCGRFCLFILCSGTFNFHLFLSIAQFISYVDRGRGEMCWIEPLWRVRIWRHDRSRQCIQQR